MSARNKIAYPHWLQKWRASGALSHQMPRAIVREIDGRLVLDDPDAVAMIRAIGKTNCINTLEINGTRVIHFANRIIERGSTGKDMVIVVINVDDPHGGPIAEVLMPGHDWQQYRDRKEVPFARGLAERSGMQEIISAFDKEAAGKLKGMPDEVVVIVVDHSVAEVFLASTVINGIMMIGCECDGWKKGLSITFDSEDAREQGWKACPFCKTPFRIEVAKQKKAA